MQPPEFFWDVRNTFLDVRNANPSTRRVRSVSPDIGAGRTCYGNCKLFLFRMSEIGSWEVFLRQPVAGLFVPLEAAIEARDCFNDEGVPNMAMGGVRAARRAGSLALGVDMSLRPEGDFLNYLLVMWTFGNRLSYP